MQEINNDIFSGNKWELLKEVSYKPVSPTELAITTKTSLSNIIQQLKLLEAYNLVRKEKSTEKSSGGKPKTMYSLSNEFVFAAIVKQGLVEKKFYKIEGMSKVFFNILFIAGIEDLFFIMKFSMKHEDLLFKKCKAIGFIKSTKETIELFLVTDNLDEIRSKFSNVFIEDAGKTKKIINWSHNEHEIADGISRKDKYYLDMMKTIQIIHDPYDILENAQKKKN
jgi:hypothetical protein